MTPPPGSARRLLERRLPDSVRPFFLADLDERYEAYARRSRWKADLWYWRQAVAAVWSPLPGAAGVETTGLFYDLVGDLRGAVRTMSRRPAPAVASIVTLGLGLGVSAAAFSILYGTVLRGLPFEEADRLVHFERADLPAGQSSLAVTPHDYLAWLEAQTSFEDLGAYVEAATTLPIDGAPPVPLSGVRISANAFSLLRVQPLHGRSFTPADEEVGAPDVVVLSHDVWTARFGADPGVVGRAVRLGEAPVTVIGVMPPRFGFPIAEDFWIPLRIDLATIVRGQGRLDVFGRLRPESSLTEARAEFDGITSRLSAAYPETNADITASLRSFHDEYVGEEFTRTAYRMLFGALLLLVLCCANVANLLLVSGSRRRGDLVLRVSLGATRQRIARQLLTEASLLAAGGALLGTLLAWYGVTWFDRVGAQAGVFALPHGSDSLFWWDIGLDLPTVAFLMGVAGLAALMSGLVPAVGLSDAAAGGRLRSRGRIGRGPGSSFASEVLVVTQLALTTGLLVAAGLVVRSSMNIESAGRVIEADDVLVANVALTGGGFSDDAARRVFTEELGRMLSGGAAAQRVAVGTTLPLTLPHSVGFATPDAPDPEAHPETGVVSVSTDYFAVFGVAADEGRTFEAGDRVGGELVAVVNRTFADRYLPLGGAVGSQIRLDADAEPWLTVVGVVPDLWRRHLEPEREAGVYLPLAQLSVGDGAVRLGRLGLRYPEIVVEGRGDPAATVAAARDAVFGIDPTVPIRSLRSLDEVVAQRTGRYRVWGRFYLALAVAGTLLAMLGVYSVLSFRVAERTAEIGVRRALGATTAVVQRGVMGTAGRQVVLGAVLGLALGGALAGGMARILFGVDTHDPVIFTSVAGVVALVGLTASWLPARRAGGIDPVEAIRQR